MLYSVGLIYEDSRRSTDRYSYSHGKLRRMFGGECERRMGIIQGPTLFGRYNCALAWKGTRGTLICGSYKCSDWETITGLAVYTHIIYQVNLD
jgi:hypothetical protein